MIPIPPPEPPPTLRVPDWELPSYRYVPGLNPHPFRSPDGHLYTDGTPPTQSHWSPKCPWHEDRNFLRGLDLFDHRYYWESHETWEGIWHQVPKNASFSLLLQALIQSGAYTLKIHCNQKSPALKLLERVQKRLEIVEAREGSHYCGLTLATIVPRLEAFGTGGAWPVLHG
jgi:hypothetical protein